MLAIFLPILSVIIGFSIATYTQRSTRSIQLLLSYSGALLLSVTIFEFIPEVYRNYTPLTGILIMTGVLLQVILEFMSKGAEHGHLHHDENLKRFPFLIFISLCIHSLMEGFPIAQNLHLLLGVVIHKIPVAVIISTFLIRAELPKRNLIFFMAIFALMTPLGAVLSDYFMKWPEVEHDINAVVIGIFLHVSTTILFESSKNHQFNGSKILLIILGVATAYFI